MKKLQARDPLSNKKRLIRRLRSTVRVTSRFLVRDLGDGREEQTCKTCGDVKIITHPGQYTAVTKKLIAYRAHNGGVWGVCKACSKRAAAERYPMPE